MNTLEKSTKNTEQMIKYKYKPKILNDLCYDDDFINELQYYKNLDEFKLILCGPSHSGKTTLIECFLNVINANGEFDVLHLYGLEDMIFNKFQQTVHSFCHYSFRKKKIIVIDDIDFLNENFQLYLKDVIESIAYQNVNIIISIKDQYKILQALRSRMQLIQVTRYDQQKLKKLLTNVLNKEKIVLNDDCINYLIKYSKFSIQQIFAHIEKLRLVGKSKFTMTEMCELCSIYDSEIMEKYTTFCLNGDIKSSIHLINQYIEIGYNVIDFLEMYFEYIKYNDSISQEVRLKIIEIISRYIIYFNTIHEDECELYLFSHDVCLVCK